MLKGTMYITDNMDIVKNSPIMGTILISLDEDGILDITQKNVISGTCLLPPPQAMIAEADGREDLYDMIYGSHLMSPNINEYISALIASVYKGTNLLFYLPEMNQNNTAEKLTGFLYKLYGIHPGIIGHPDLSKNQWYIDLSCSSMWMNSIYTMRVIDPYEYLYMYPSDAIIDQTVMNLLIEDINPYGETYNQLAETIEGFRKRIKKNPNLRLAINLLR